MNHAIFKNSNIVAVNIPADGLFLAILNKANGDLSENNCIRIIKEYIDKHLEANPDIIMLNVCYRRCLTPSAVFDSYLYNIETNENGQLLKKLSPVTDGVSKAATDSYYVYAKDMSCAEVLLEAIPVYVTEEWSEDAVAELAAAGIYSVYAEDGVVKYNDTSLVVTELLDEEEMKYTAELVK